MAQEIALQRIGNYDTEGLQQLQDELRHEDYEMQRQTSEEVRNEQLRIRQIFRTVRLIWCSCRFKWSICSG